MKKNIYIADLVLQLLQSVLAQFGSAKKLFWQGGVNDDLA